jgi:2-polyprenyl-3-methyl-5-hydroxy-6-metoxy-1,4-benzoquinol methylase
MPLATTVTSPHADATRLRRYWEDRARQFAHVERGLGAVCSYGMPAFYNRHIDVLQRRALAPWLRLPHGARVLEVGCGVGRWSTWLAARGAHVTAMDLSTTMIVEARRRAAAEGVADRCRFLVADVATLAFSARFDCILGVTVLQHQVDARRWKRAVHGLADHLAPGGRIVLLEAAPSAPNARCDHPAFTARTAEAYLEVFERAGLECLAVAGVDPAPFKTAFLPRYPGMPRLAASAALAAVTAAGFVVDLVAAPWCSGASWHKVFVLQRASRGGRQ